MSLVYSSFSYALFSKKPDLLEVENRTIKVYKDVTTSVVNITNFSTMSRRSFFSSGPVQQEKQVGAGTGFIWDNKGHIITNYHVVANVNTKLMVSFNGSKNKLEAKIVGIEPKLDIAVLKVKSLPPGVTPIKPGKSKGLQVGQIAMAIGNPFELGYSMSKGIISALGRKIQGIGGVDIHNMIQTDATINPGNSGGPLLDSSGKLIGMNTMIYSRSGASDGIGFAVPVDDIKLIVPDLIRYGKVKRPALGIKLMPDHYANALRSYGYTQEKDGIIIAEVLKGSAADQAGLQETIRDRNGDVYMGDIILKIDGMKVNSYNDIFHALRKFNIGERVNITVRKRSGAKKTLKLKLQELEE